ncbi:SPW repeat protein [Streptomyces sp. NPDC126514]|uniref:SPW repeat protein n=1 Tax=Streptomyces sp. NPDC126514 TaxID=3155210 RepID=UPI00332CC97B
MSYTRPPMESHPDILEMRAQHERAAITPRAQGIEALGVITGLYLAASPWIVGFNGLSTLAVTNLIAGIAYAMLMAGFGHAYERTHSMAWAAAALGAWTIVAPWVVAGDVDTTRTITNNVIVGVIACLLALAAAAGANMPSGRRSRGASGYGSHGEGPSER